MSLELHGRVIRAGRAEGEALVSIEPISFYGGVDLDTGVVTERGHPLEGRALAGLILLLPRGKGSTVGSWALLRLGRRGLGPAALVCRRCDTIVAVGAILAEVPCVDGIDIHAFRSGTRLVVEGDCVREAPVT
jgi:uncharacterized protein